MSFVQIYKESDVILRIPDPEATTTFKKMLVKLKKAHKRPGFLKIALTKAEVELLENLINYFEDENN